MWGQLFCQENGGTPLTLGNKKARRVNTPGPKMRRPRDPWLLRASHEATSSLPTQERSSASQIAGRRDEPPGLSLSPGAEHSSKAEIAPQQLPKALCHFDSPPFSYNTYLFDWFGSIIPQPHWVVKPFFRLFWWELGFCEKSKKTPPAKVMSFFFKVKMLCLLKIVPFLSVPLRSAALHLLLVVSDHQTPA